MPHTVVDPSNTAPLTRPQVQLPDNETSENGGILCLYMYTYQYLYIYTCLYKKSFYLTCRGPILCGDRRPNLPLQLLEHLPQDEAVRDGLKLGQKRGQAVQLKQRTNTNGRTNEQKVRSGFTAFRTSVRRAEMQWSFEVSTLGEGEGGNDYGISTVPPQKSQKIHTLWRM